MKMATRMLVICLCVWSLTACSPTVEKTLVAASATEHLPMYQGYEQFQDTDAPKTMSVTILGKQYEGQYAYSRTADSYALNGQRQQIDYYDLLGRAENSTDSFGVASDTKQLLLFSNVDGTIDTGADPQMAMKTLAKDYMPIENAVLKTDDDEYTYTVYINDLPTQEQLSFNIDETDGSIWYFSANGIGSFQHIRNTSFMNEIVKRLDSEEAHRLMEQKLKEICPKDRYPHVDDYKITEKVVKITENGTIGLFYTVEFKGHGEGPLGQAVDGFAVIKTIILEYR